MGSVFSAVLLLLFFIGYTSLFSVGITSLYNILIALVGSLITYGVLVLVLGSFGVMLTSSIISFFESPQTKLLKEKKILDDEKKRMEILIAEENKISEMKKKEEKRKVEKLAQGLYLQNYSRE